MKEVYSKVDKDVLLHIVHRKEDVSEKRIDISPASQFLQVSCVKLPKDKTFTPHKHITQIRTSDICQESWIVIDGKIKITLYDIDDSIIEEMVLIPGDISVTYRGGHTFTSLEEDTIVYEHKNGPYYGKEADKETIG